MAARLFLTHLFPTVKYLRGLGSKPLVKRSTTQPVIFAL